MTWKPDRIEGTVRIPGEHRDIVLDFSLFPTFTGVRILTHNTYRDYHSLDTRTEVARRLEEFFQEQV